MPEIIDKEVYFDKYCSSCKYCGINEDEEPCHWCLQDPYNQYSHKPVYWEEDDTKPLPVAKKQ